ncbi:putative ABC transport system permease protein [Microbacterium sp. AG1240]|uniref:ABC transporter permease n=1 Tax=Microbacterium sp. AG1240 TaxID=2183992 RepID=UPI000EAE971F|nr:FtsX-like permease family protein [Microbacterium sp. AG1240]RKT35913.1 putative ABC transport system permease protein [Microbacterium sp. AG1240]
MTAVAVQERAVRPAASARPLAWLRERGMGASVLVAALSSAFAVVLMSTTAFISIVLRSDPFIGGSETLVFILGFLTVLLVGVAVYVAAIVTANTFATVVAGRTRQIALLRLIGASAKAQRAEVARQGLIVGAIGATLGFVIGTVLSLGGAQLAVQLMGLALVDDVSTLLQPLLVLPVVVVALTTWGAAWAGSRRVLTVTPLQALGGSVEPTRETVARRSGRNIAALVLFVIGGGLLALGIAVGLVTPLGVAISFVGGIFSFTALALGATFVMPPVLRLVGRLFGRSATARLAAENALRYPERSSRMAIGVVMGVTLVTMFAVALETVKAVLTASSGGELDPGMATLIDSFSAIMMALVAVSAVIAGVGLVNLLTIGVVQRRRELGLLRALGMSNAQVRRMVLLEAAHVTIAALVTGLVLGIAYGWAGAQSVLGSVRFPPAWLSPTFVLPAVPLWPVLAVIVATAILTLVAAVVPTRLATRVAPVAALAE